MTIKQVLSTTYKIIIFMVEIKPEILFIF